MAKKYPSKKSASKEINPSPASNQKPKISAGDLAVPVFCMIYMLVHFIPNFDAYDAMGPQWLYVIIVDLIVILFILARKNDYTFAAAAIFKNIFSRLYIAFFALAGLSVFAAINPTETWVCYVRLIATIIAFFNIAILLYGRQGLFRWLAQLMALILLVESCMTIKEFLDGVGEMSMTQLILNLKGTAGNKNIFAAGLVVKIPFVFYCIYTSGLWGKMLNIPILIVGSLTLFLVNARASYLSLLLVTLLYIIFIILQYKKEKRIEQTLYRASYILLPIIAALFISKVELTNAANLEDQKQTYGTVTERFASITSEGDFIRFQLWQHAIDYTKHHPLMGCGYGNWKIASIPYQRIITNDLIVPVHSHNDFLENFAELGIPGGLLYLSLFVCILVFTIKVYLSKTADEETKYMSLFSAFAFTGYSIDAFFNFPMERPLSQVLFAFITALNVMAYIRSTETTDVSSKAGMFKSLYGLIALAFLIPSSYVSYLTYKSLILQRTVLQDLNNEPLKLNWKEVVPAFPSIPNLTATAQPVDAIKGRYLYEVGKYDEALVLLDKGRIANPVVAYAEFLKAGVYYRLNKFDTASKYATIAFYTRPRAKTYYQTLIAILSKTKDTAAIKKAFHEYDTYRHGVYPLNLYLIGMLNARGTASQELINKVDSGLHEFANDHDVKDLVKRKAELLSHMGVVPGTPVNNAAQLEAQKYVSEGVAAFGAGNLAKAAHAFIKAGSLNPKDYTMWENAGMSYFNMKDFKSALEYFSKALGVGTSADGKSEFFKGVSLINLGRKEEGCTFLKASKAKGYKEKETELNNFLKTICGVQ